MPLFEPTLTKLDHSSPAVREAADRARSSSRAPATSGHGQRPGRSPPSSARSRPRGGRPRRWRRSGDIAAEFLEQALGGAVKGLFHAAPPGSPAAAPLPRRPRPSVRRRGPLRGGGGAFRSGCRSAKAILNSADGKDYAVDIQNAILAFAGRVLLKGCDLRFERGHRYGLVGQNGTGKTTLLNRLGAKDITGFPQELRTWYIRHEVLCDDGVDVRASSPRPAEKRTDASIEAILTRSTSPRR